MESQRYLPQGPYAFTRESIESLRENCGIFVLYNEEGCVLAGQTNNLRSKIMRHLEEPDECLKLHWPTQVEIEPLHASKIGSRWAAFIQGLAMREIQPLCPSES